MSNKLFQSIVHQMHDAVGRTIGVIDETSVDTEDVRIEKFLILLNL